MSIKLSEEVASKLSGAGMTGKNYRRNPVSGSGFIINSTTKGDHVRVWRTKDADIDIKTDKDHTQAVLAVDEKARILERKQEQSIYIGRHELREGNEKEILKKIKERARRHNPLFGVGGRRSTTVTTPKADMDKLIAKAIKDQTFGKKVKMTHKLKSPAQAMSILTGIDETAHFICMLPKRAESVEHAHDILRPSRVAKGTKRQGEFFFRPASKTISNKIEKALPGKMENKRNSWMVRRNVSAITLPSARFLERSSSHFAICALTYDEKLYVTGQVMDLRSTRHDPLVLEGWHEVVRNTEIPAPRSFSGRQAYWD